MNRTPWTLATAAFALSLLPSAAAPLHAHATVSADTRFLDYNDGIVLQVIVINRGPSPVCLDKAALSMRSVQFIASPGERISAGADPVYDGSPEWSKSRSREIPADGKTHSFYAPASLSAFAKGAYDLNRVQRTKLLVTASDCGSHRPVFRRWIEKKFTPAPVH